MQKLKPFAKGERVCFIGDSITQGTTWITHIADYYAKERPNDRVDIIPCGVGGGTCISAMLYLHGQTASWSPTTVVIMVGMNDIGRKNFKDNPTEKEKEAAVTSVENYERNLFVLSSMIKNHLKAERIIYLGPTPYDEISVSETPIVTGSWKALRECNKIMQKAALEFGGEYYDFGGELFQLLKESVERNSKNTLISLDRVHPNEFGQSVMARLFLNAQGFSEMAVDCDMICDGSAKLNLNAKTEKYYEFARGLQIRWELEWLMSRFFTDKTDEGKRKCTENFKADHPNCTIDEAYWAANYWRYHEEEEKNREALKKAIDDMYSQAK